MTDVDTGAAVAAAEPAAIAPQTVEAPISTMDAIEKSMSVAYDKINPPRSDGGQFAPKEKAEAGTEPAKPITDQTQTTEAIEPAKPAIEAPVSWSAEMKAKWASLSPEAQTYVAQRETEAHKRISELGQTAKDFQPFQHVINQYRGDFESLGVHPAEGFAAMMNVQRLLGSNFEAGIEEIAKQFGKPSPYTTNASNAEPGDESGIIRSLNAKIQQLERQVGETVSKVTARERSEFEREQAELASTIEKFSKDKPHFEAVRKVMAGLMNSGAADTLEDAYDMAVHANKSIRETLDADKRKADQEKQAEEAKKKADAAKKAASLNVRSSNASPARKGSWEQTLRDVGERIAS